MNTRQYPSTNLSNASIHNLQLISYRLHFKYLYFDKLAIGIPIHYNFHTKPGHDIVGTWHDGNLLSYRPKISLLNFERDGGNLIIIWLYQENRGFIYQMIADNHKINGSKWQN